MTKNASNEPPQVPRTVTTLWRGLSQHPRAGKYNDRTGLILYEA
ncbi:MULTISPECIES: hypothetical protein [unclassified Bartonella]